MNSPRASEQKEGVAENSYFQLKKELDLENEKRFLVRQKYKRVPFQSFTRFEKSRCCIRADGRRASYTQYSVLLTRALAISMSHILQSLEEYLCRRVPRQGSPRRMRSVQIDAQGHLTGRSLSGATISPAFLSHSSIRGFIYIYL